MAKQGDIDAHDALLPARRTFCSDQEGVLQGWKECVVAKHCTELVLVLEMHGPVPPAEI